MPSSLRIFSKPIAEAHLHLADHAQDRLAAGGTGVLDRLDRFGAEPRHHRHETCEQALLVEREVTGRTDRSDVDRLWFGTDFGAGLVDRIGHDLRHRLFEKLSELGLMVCGDIDLFHCASLSDPLFIFRIADCGFRIWPPPPVVPTI